MAKMIKCKDCGGMMAKSVKACPHCGSRKRHNKISALTTISILLIILFSFVAIKMLATTETPEIPSQSSATSAGEQNNDSVLLDNEFVTVTYSKISDAVGIKGAYLYLKVENHTDKTVWVYLDKASVNNQMVSVLSAVPMTITASKYSSNPFILSFDGSANDVENIEFSVVVCDNDTSKTLFTSDAIKVNP